MLNLTTITTQLHQLKVVPVIALDHAEDILPLADTLAQNGLPVAEITFRSQEFPLSFQMCFRF